MTCVSVVSCRPTVKLLSSEDGKQRIVQAAQQLCRSVEKNAMSSKDISVSMLDGILRGTDDRYSRQLRGHPVPMSGSEV